MSDFWEASNGCGNWSTGYDRCENGHWVKVGGSPLDCEPWDGASETDGATDSLPETDGATDSPSDSPPDIPDSSFDTADGPASLPDTPDSPGG